MRLRKLLSAKWWIGPPPGPLVAVRRRRAVQRWQAMVAQFRKADREYQSLGLAPRIQCPICGHQGWSFYPFGSKRVEQGPTSAVSPHSGFHGAAAAAHPASSAQPRVNPFQWVRYDAECPSCGSWERHRLTKMALDELGAKSWQGPLLHIAPEPHLGTVLRAISGVEYKTADLYDPGVDYQVDIQELPFEDSSWSYIICSHVLEHVPDDERALSELRRVLRPGGILVLCVPCIPFYERPRLTVALEPGSLLRSLHGHYRSYGVDFVERVGRHFTVEDRSAERRPVQEVLRHGLMMWYVVSDMLLVCRR
ncbi:MAG: methyltransferase domain-containing protein [Armatimonadota bacterium]